MSPTESPQTHSQDRLEQTLVGTEMSTGVVSCAPGEPVIALAGRMANHGTHAVVIAGLWDDDDDELRWGTVSHATVVHALAEGREDAVAADLESRKVVTCDHRDTMLAAAELMRSERVDHLVALDGDDPVGVISTIDVMRVASR